MATNLPLKVFVQQWDVRLQCYLQTSGLHDSKRQSGENFVHLSEVSGKSLEVPCGYIFTGQQKHIEKRNGQLGVYK